MTARRRAGRETVKDRLITIHEAAGLFGVPRWKLYKWVRDGELAAVKHIPSTGRTGELALFKLSEIAHTVAADHERRHAETEQQR